MNDLRQIEMEISFFSARIFRRLHTNKHFVSDLPTRVETQNISLKNNQLNVSNAPKKLWLTSLWLKKEYFTVWMNYFYPEEKLTTREHCAIETLITNPLVKERVFYCLNDRFVSNRFVDIIFSTRIFRTLQAWNISQRLAKACWNSELFLKAKITKCELSAIEALITKPLETKGYFTVWMRFFPRKK